jgi:hypothetical protein
MYYCDEKNIGPIFGKSTGEATTELMIHPEKLQWARSIVPSSLKREKKNLFFLLFACARIDVY